MLPLMQAILLGVDLPGPGMSPSRSATTASAVRAGGGAVLAPGLGMSTEGLEGTLSAGCAGAGAEEGKGAGLGPRGLGATAGAPAGAPALRHMRVPSREEEDALIEAALAEEGLAEGEGSGGEGQLEGQQHAAAAAATTTALQQPATAPKAGAHPSTEAAVGRHSEEGRHKALSAWEVTAALHGSLGSSTGERLELEAGLAYLHTELPEHYGGESG